MNTQELMDDNRRLSDLVQKLERRNEQQRLNIRNLTTALKAAQETLEQAGGICYPPWTEEQVENLERRQEAEWLHPYTCVCGHSLVPYTEGWTCDECPHTQDWAHQRDIDGTF